MDIVNFVLNRNCLAIAKFLAAEGRTSGEQYLRIETADARHERPSGKLLLTLWSEEAGVAGGYEDEEIARVSCSWEEVCAMKAMTHEELVEASILF